MQTVSLGMKCQDPIFQDRKSKKNIAKNLSAESAPSFVCVKLLLTQKPTDLDLHCLSLNMWIYFNILD